MKKFLLLLLFFLPFLGFAQSGVQTPYGTAPIVIDTITKKTLTPLPFDRNFNLQYTLTPGDSLYNVLAYQIELNRSDQKTVTRVLKFEKVHGATSPGNPSSQVVPVIVTFDTAKNVVIIHVNSLQPNTLMDVAMLKKLNTKQIDWLLNYNEDYYHNYTSPSPIIQGELLKVYNDFINTLKAPQYHNGINFRKYSYDDYKKNFVTTFKVWLDAIKTADYINFTPSSSPNTCPPLPNQAAINLSVTPQFSDFQAIDAQLTLKKITDDDLLPLMTVIDQGVFTQFLQGRVDITSKYPAGLQADEDDYESRIDNLATGVAYMEKLIFLLEKAKANGIAVPAAMIQHAINCHEKLKINLKVISQNYTAMLHFIRTCDGLNKEIWLITENDFNDLTLLSKSVLMPELGFVTMALKGHQKYQFIPRPFVGVDIYLRPIDKTLKKDFFSKDNYDWKRYFSIQLGLTYGSLGTSKEFTNLFNDFSIMGGVGIRMFRWFRLSGGTILTQQTDVNPIISQIHINFGYYAAFSFDLDILSNASSLTARAFK